MGEPTHFVIVGMQRNSTAVTHDYLQGHPEVRTPAEAPGDRTVVQPRGARVARAYRRRGRNAWKSWNNPSPHGMQPTNSAQSAKALLAYTSSKNACP